MKKRILLSLAALLFAVNAHGQGIEIGGGGNREFPFAACAAGVSGLIWDNKASGAATAGGCGATNVIQGVANFTNTQFLENHFYLPLGVVNVAATLIWSSAQTAATGTWALTMRCVAIDGTATDDDTYQTFWAPSQSTSPGTANRVTATTGSGISLPASCTGGNKWAHIKLTWTAGTATSFNANTLYLSY